MSHWQEHESDLAIWIAALVDLSSSSFPLLPTYNVSTTFQYTVYIPNSYNLCDQDLIYCLFQNNMLVPTISNMAYYKESMGIAADMSEAEFIYWFS